MKQAIQSAKKTVDKYFCNIFGALEKEKQSHGECKANLEIMQKEIEQMKIDLFEHHSEPLAEKLSLFLETKREWISADKFWKKLSDDERLHTSGRTLDILKHDLRRDEVGVSQALSQYKMFKQQLEIHEQRYVKAEQKLLKEGRRLGTKEKKLWRKWDTLCHLRDKLEDMQIYLADYEDWCDPRFVLDQEDLSEQAPSHRQEAIQSLLDQIREFVDLVDDEEDNLPGAIKCRVSATRDFFKPLLGLYETPLEPPTP